MIYIAPKSRGESGRKNLIVLALCLRASTIYPPLLTCGVVVVASDVQPTGRTKQYKLVPATGWEGNRRSCVALVIRHRLSGTGSMAWEREMSTPPRRPKLHSEY